MTQRDPFRDLHVAINAMFEVVRAKKDRRNPSPADVRETRAFRVLFADAKGRAQQRGLFIGELQSAFRDLDDYIHIAEQLADGSPAQLDVDVFLRRVKALREHLPVGDGGTGA